MAIRLGMVTVNERSNNRSIGKGSCTALPHTQLTNCLDDGGSVPFHRVTANHSRAMAPNSPLCESAERIGLRSPLEALPLFRGVLRCCPAGLAEWRVPKKVSTTIHASLARSTAPLKRSNSLLTAPIFAFRIYVAWYLHEEQKK
jgi:hypothetical protein